MTDLEIEVDRGNERVVSWRPRFRIIDTADVAPDAAIVAKVAAYNNDMAKELDAELGSLTAPVESTQAVVRTKEAAIGNLFADAIREAVGGDVAIVNGGGIRGDRKYASGHKLLRRDVLTELPFANKVVLVEMRGRDLKTALENGLTFAGKPNGRYPQVSGVQVVARSDAVPGKKIETIMVGGQPLKPDALYRVATNDFIASGREGYDVFVDAKRIIAETDGPLVSNAVMGFIRTRGTVSPQVEGRLVLK
jgi:5'-nucleotidase / UDP-sugar diphosphatase